VRQQEWRTVRGGDQQRDGGAEGEGEGKEEGEGEGEERAPGRGGREAEAVGVDGPEVSGLGQLGDGDPRAAHPREGVDRHLRQPQAGGARLRRRRLLLLRRPRAQVPQDQLPRRAAPGDLRDRPCQAQHRRREEDI